jgi:methyltransferase (TIGR00027 family)
MTDPALRNVSDTARWVAIYRAMESERADALFHDPYARQLGGERGEQIVRTLPRGTATAWPMIVRTMVFDEILLRLVDPHGSAPVDTVINLAAGLDARPYRLALPSTLHWVEVDLPGILEYKEEILAPHRPVCRLERVRLDLTEEAARQELFARLGTEARCALTITEGLLIYLTEPIVAGLARDLGAQRSFRWWLSDLASPRLLKLMKRSWGRTLDAAQASFRFAPAAGLDFFTPLGWQAHEVRQTWAEARRLDRRPPRAWLYELLGRLTPPKKRAEMQDISRYILLENTTAQPS